MMIKNIERRTNRGLTLIELLVVIVVLAVGILTLIRMYPRGITTLGLTRDYATAQGLARRELNRLERNAADLPSQILAVRYTFIDVGGGNYQLRLIADPDVPNYDLGAGGDILEDGTIFIDDPSGGPGAYVFWRYYNAANRYRRIIGEGGVIPAPKRIGVHYGSLRILQFGPIINDPSLLLVYGNDMIGRFLQDTNPGEFIRNPRPFEFAYDDEVPQMWLPGSQNRVVAYKINYSYYERDATLGYRRVDVIDQIVKVTPAYDASDPTPQALYDHSTRTVEPFDLLVLSGANPANFIEMVPDSISANRLFDRLNETDFFSPSYPYEYKVLNAELGMILINPAAHTFQEPRPRGRQPLVAKVNYDVYNWHIIRDEFRADNTKAPIHKLSLDRIKAIGDLLNDKRRYPGLDIPLPDGTGNFIEYDVVVIDMETGGMVMPFVNPNNPNQGRSYNINYLRGTVSLGSPFNQPPQSSNDLAQSITILPPGTNQPLITNVNPANRNFRVLYQAHNDWAVQVLKSSARFQVSYTLPLGYSQCYVGSSNPNIGGFPTRIYFPWCEVFNKVTFREIWYFDSFNNLRSMRDQEFLVRPPLATDPLQLPYVDIREADSTASFFDFENYGYAIRGVTGTSVRARVIWNADQKEDVVGNTAQAIQERMEIHQNWTNQWRIVQVETNLTRRDGN